MSRPLSARVQFVDTALEAWARWAAGGLQALGYPRVTILAKLAEQGFTGASHRSHEGEVDPAVLYVEAAILRLPERERKAIIVHYMHWEAVEGSARRCHCSVTQFRQALALGRREVAAYLEGALAGARRAATPAGREARQ